MPELAQLMIDLGAVTALNLDGGGSSTILSHANLTVMGLNLIIHRLTVPKEA